MSETVVAELTADLTMGELLKRYSGAQRVLFQKYHIGGCSHCGFQPEESLYSVCARNGLKDQVEEVLTVLRTSQKQDEANQVSPLELKKQLEAGSVTILDIRTREEFEAVNIPGSILFTQDLMNEIMGKWEKDRAIVVVDHLGARSLDAAAYFWGHGFTNMKGLKGGIDAYAHEAEPTMPRYTAEDE